MHTKRHRQSSDAGHTCAALYSTNCAVPNNSHKYYINISTIVKKYSEAAEVRRSTFTPIIASCKGIFDHEAQIYMKRMSTLLASKWGKSYSQEQECKCVFFALLVCAFEDQELNSEELVSSMVLRYHCTVIEPTLFLLSFIIYACFALFLWS